MNDYQTRFVKLKTECEPSKEFEMTFLCATGSEKASENGIIKHIAKSAPEKAKRLEIYLNKLLNHNDVFFAWLEACPANSQLFLEDPVSAIKKAIPQVNKA